MKTMIADYMENGFLENIISLLKQDKNLFPILGHLISDERARVRVGAVALVETLRGEYLEEIRKAIPEIAKGLSNPNPTIRADSAYLLGMIGHRDAVPYLSKALNDENPLVKETVEETIVELSKNPI